MIEAPNLLLHSFSVSNDGEKALVEFSVLIYYQFRRIRL